jgi:hypothetical protein
MNRKMNGLIIGAAASTLLLLAGCGSINTSPNPSAQLQTGTVGVVISDDPTQDWATIGVEVLSISLTPQGGGTAVPVYTASSAPPMINLVQLDQLGEILGNAKIPLGTYTSATLTLSADNTGGSCDVLLVASADPEVGFDVPAGTTVPCSQIAFAGATGTAPNTTVTLPITLATPLTVTENSSNALDLEFDLKHPALLVEHQPVGATAPTWVVNFNGPVRHHPRPDLTKLFLRHIYGQAVSVSTTTTTDDTLNISRAFPVHPITSPETATVPSTSTIPILADTVNGTLFFNLDNSNTPTTIDNFSTVASELPGMYVRIAARYQVNGTLVAARVYASSKFNTIWQNPEGHVLHVNTAKNVMWVTTEDGNAKELAIGSETNFYYGSSNTLIGTGTGFFDGTTPGNLPNIARGFKVNATIDPLSAATPPVALSVEIDIARYDGVISGPPNNTDFEYIRTFADADTATRPSTDNYTGTIDYINSASANTTPAGAAVDGFYYWDLGFPTLPTTGSNAVTDFIAATSGWTNFGGVLGTLKPVGMTYATWNNIAAPNTWSAPWTVLIPVEAPLGTVTTPPSDVSNPTFTYTVPVPTAAAATAPTAQAATVELTTASGSATLVYQVDRQSAAAAIVTITPQDISNPTTLATVVGNLKAGTPIKVFGVPQSTGDIQAYVLFYYTSVVSTK